MNYDPGQRLKNASLGWHNNVPLGFIYFIYFRDRKNPSYSFSDDTVVRVSNSWRLISIKYCI